MALDGQSTGKIREQGSKRSSRSTAISFRNVFEEVELHCCRSFVDRLERVLSDDTWRKARKAAGKMQRHLNATQETRVAVIGRT